jgi:hypothetical protein
MKPFLHGKLHARKYGGTPEDQDAFENTFGDHVYVVMHRDGTYKVEEHDHE